MSVEEREEERRYDESAAEEGRQALFRQPIRRFRLREPVVAGAEEPGRERWTWRN